jgi:hypothetical protein
MNQQVPNNKTRVANQLSKMKQGSTSDFAPAGGEALRLSRNLRRMKRRLLLSLADEQEQVLKTSGGSSRDLSVQGSFDKSNREFSVHGSFEESHEK